MTTPLEHEPEQNMAQIMISRVTEGEKPPDINSRIKWEVWATVCVSFQQVREQNRKFKCWVSNMADTAISDPSHTANGTNAEVERMKRGDQLATVAELDEELKINHGWMHHIIHKVLH